MSKEKRTVPSEDLKAFGNLIRDERKARNWSLEALAAAALLNSFNKGRVSKVEHGKAGNITPETAKTFANALDIDRERVPASLRWPETRAEAEQKESALARIDGNVEILVQAASLKVLDFDVDDLPGGFRLVDDIQAGGLRSYLRRDVQAYYGWDEHAQSDPAPSDGRSGFTSETVLLESLQ